MIYITVRQSPRYHQLTLEEYLLSEYKEVASPRPVTGTYTHEVENVPARLHEGVNTEHLVGKLEEFNRQTVGLRERDRASLYNTFHIPKKTGGLREINAPNAELMDALRRLKDIFETDFHALYHTSAFAYIRGRCTIDAVKKHQINESRWFAKLDLHDFFGSTNVGFVMKMFSMIFPFCEVVKTDRGEKALAKALDLAFLNGGLPQGTPISPLITNVMMIPVDFRLTKKFRDFGKQRFVYTRYADDFIVSSKYDFDVRKIEREIVNTLREVEAPFTINEKKTRYGSSAGRNWNLGVMLNKDNDITVGNKNKRRLQSMLHNYIRDKKNGVLWEKGDIYTMQGLISYYRMVEKKNINAIIRHINEKEGVNVEGLIKADLKSPAI